MCLNVSNETSSTSIYSGSQKVMQHWNDLITATFMQTTIEKILCSFKFTHNTRLTHCIRYNPISLCWGLFYLCRACESLSRPAQQLQRATSSVQEVELGIIQMTNWLLTSIPIKTHNKHETNKNITIYKKKIQQRLWIDAWNSLKPKQVVVVLRFLNFKNSNFEHRTANIPVFRILRHIQINLITPKVVNGFDGIQHWIVSNVLPIFRLRAAHFLRCFRHVHWRGKRFVFLFESRRQWIKSTKTQHKSNRLKLKLP